MRSGWGAACVQFVYETPAMGNCGYVTPPKSEVAKGNSTPTGPSREPLRPQPNPGEAALGMRRQPRRRQRRQVRRNYAQQGLGPIRICEHIYFNGVESMTLSQNCGSSRQVQIHQTVSAVSFGIDPHRLRPAAGSGRGSSQKCKRRRSRTRTAAQSGCQVWRPLRHVRVVGWVA